VTEQVGDLKQLSTG